MIIDKLENLGRYSPAIPFLDDLVKYISATDVNSLTAGRHDVDGNGVFILRFEYQTKPIEECVIEAHQKYIDVHVVLDGAEQIGVGPVAECDAGEYDEAKDFMPLKGVLGRWDLKAGNFAILFPGEAHATGGLNLNVCQVRKMVAKVPYSG